MRVLSFTSHWANLRATAVVDSLRARGYQVSELMSGSGDGGVFEMLRSALVHSWTAMRGPADLAVGFKPHLNVTLPLLICRLRGIPTWIDVDDLDYAYRSGWRGRLIRWSQRPFPRLFDLTTYHHERLRDHLLGELRCQPERVVRVPQGVHCRRFENVEDRAIVRAVLGIGPGPVAVYPAHLNIASELDAILIAWQRVVRAIPAARLLVLGDGPRLREYRALAASLGVSGEVIFAGAVPHHEVPRYLAGADLGVLYARDRLANRHRCSLKLREYLAAGLRVACNDVGELADFAPYSYQTGGSLNDYGDLVIRLLAGEGDGREQRGRAFVKAQMDWPEVIDTALPAIDAKWHPQRPSPGRLKAIVAEGRRVFRTTGLDTLILFVTNACNLRCGFCCYADNLNQTKDIPFDDLIRLSRSMPPFRALLVSGGEPFIRPRLDEILLSFVRHNGVRSIYIPTNGWYLDRTEAICRSFLDQEREAMLTLSFSVDGLEATHDRIRTKGKLRSFEALCQTIERLSPWRERYPNLRLRLNSVVTPDNIDEMPATVDYFYDRFALDEHALEIVRDLSWLGAHHDSPERAGIAGRYDALVQYAYRRYYLTSDRPRRAQFGYLPDSLSDRATYAFALVCSRIKRERIEGKRWPFPCTAGRRIMVVSGSGSLSACEHRGEVVDLRAVDFDFGRAMATGAMEQEVRQIAKDRCDCIHGCFVGNGLQHAPRTIAARGLPIVVGGMRRGK